MITGLAVED